MKIACISDIHDQYDDLELPEADLLIVAGDLTSTGTVSQLQQFNRWLGEQKHKFPLGVVGIAGNHDWLFYRERLHAQQIMSHMCYLEDSEITIEGVRIYGSPHTPEFFNWAFMKPRGELIRDVWEAIPTGVDVLITHGPPMGILDGVLKFNPKLCEYELTSVGCWDLYDEIVCRIKPRAHVFGHVHGGYGKTKKFGIEFLNASVCDEHYRPRNPVQILDLR